MGRRSRKLRPSDPACSAQAGTSGCPFSRPLPRLRPMSRWRTRWLRPMMRPGEVDEVGQCKESATRSGAELVLALVVWIAEMRV